MNLADYPEIWAVDFEYRQPDGERPDIRCMVAIEYHSGRIIRRWVDELGTAVPFDTENSIVVAYYAVAEMLCFKVLNWERPRLLLDLYVEFKRMNNPHKPIGGYGLNGCLQYHGFPLIPDKKGMRDLAMRRGSVYSKIEKNALLDYCQSDVDALVKLLPVMSSKIDPDRAFYHGRYMTCIAEMEFNGVPIDVEMLQLLRSRWEGIYLTLIQEVNQDFCVYDGSTFKMAKFEDYLSQNGIIWPRTERGTPRTDDDTFRDMAKTYPKVQPLRELRVTLAQLKLNSLHVGSDHRNRCMLSPFSTVTSRNMPSNAAFIFGPATWLRGLIKPPEGYGVAYIDFSQQEFGIAAVLSGDKNMQSAYSSGDPYLEFGKMAGIIPLDGSKASHPMERSLCKQCVLAVNYQMGERSLALRIKKPLADARELLRLHRRTFPNFWAWAEGVAHYALTRFYQISRLGWLRKVNGEPNIRSLANWPVQTCGAEMLRVAIMYAVNHGIKICAPVHDALLIEAPLEVFEDHIQITRECMKAAGELLLNGFEIGTDVDRVIYPDRYMDERGARMWETVGRIIRELPN